MNAEFGRFLLSQMSDGAIVLNSKDGTIRFANNAAYKSLGFLPPDLTGKRFEDVSGVPAELINDTKGNEAEIQTWFVKNSSVQQFNIRSCAFDDEARIIIFSKIEESRETLDLLQSYVDLNKVLMMELSPQGTVRKVNNACLNLLKVTEDEILGKNWFDNYIPTQVKDEIKNRFEQVVTEEKELANFHINPVISSDGEICEVSWHNLIQRDKDGRITGILSAGEDVTDKQDLVNRLKTTRSEYSILFENMQEGVIQLDEKHCVSLINPAFSAMIGYSEDEVLGNPIIDFVPDPNVKTFLTEMFSRREQGLNDAYDLPIVTKTGESKWLNIIASPILGKNGRRIGTMGFATDVTKTREVEETLKAVEQKTRSILKAIPDRIFVIDAKGSFKFWHSADNRYSLPPEVFSKLTVEEIFPPGEGKRLMKVILKTIKTGELQKTEYEFPEEGILSSFEARLVPHGENEVLAILRNITAEKNHLKERELLQKRQRAMLKAISDEILIVSKEGFCIDYKAGILDENNYSGNPIGKNLSEIFSEKNAAKQLHYLNLAFSTNEVQHYEYSRTENGIIKSFECSMAPSSDGDAILIVRDITQRKNALCELVKSQDLYAQAEKLAQLGTWEFNLITQKVIFSDQLYQLFGFEPGDPNFNPETAFKSVPTEDAKRIKKVVSDAIEVSGDFETSFQILYPGGKEMNFITVGKVVSEKNIPVRITGIVQDVTSLRKLEKDLHEKNKELSTFIYRTSHSLRSPLTSALGLISLIRMEKQNSDIPYLDMIDNLIKKLDNILLELINVVLIKGGEVNSEEGNLFEFIQQLSNDYKYNEMFDNVTLEVNVDKKLTVKTDWVLLRAILSNLIENSIKYRKLKSGAIIKIKGCEDNKGEAFNIEIEDNGTGISEEDQERVFEMFFRAHQEVQGTGMGLYIVKNAVDKLNGNIYLSSTPKVGTKVSIRLPLN